MRRLLLAAAGVTLCATQLHAQSPADAARRAEPEAHGIRALAAARGPAAVSARTMAEDPIDLQPGAAIPDFRFVDFDGNSRDLSDFRGKYLMLSFWGTWCPYCRAEIPFANDAYARFRSRGFEILGMDYEKRATVEEVRLFLRNNRIGWTVARPDSVRDLITERFRVSSFPAIVLLDPAGRVMPVRESALRGTRLAATLDQILPR
jgi:thiol-disulfide isomerase/thioredoxin